MRFFGIRLDKSAVPTSVCPTSVWYLHVTVIRAPKTCSQYSSWEDLLMGGLSFSVEIALHQCLLVLSIDTASSNWQLQKAAHIRTAVQEGHTDIVSGSSVPLCSYKRSIPDGLVAEATSCRPQSTTLGWAHFKGNVMWDATNTRFHELDFMRDCAVPQVVDARGGAHLG